MSNDDSRPALLIVDDEPEVIQALAEILNGDYQIQVATDGNKALEVASKAPYPDLILMDIMLPGLGGFEVCRRLKKNTATRKIPLIFITMLTAEEDESYGFEMGAADYITKPFSAPIVKARVRTHLALYDQQRELEKQVQERTQELRDSRLEIIHQLGRAAEYKDNETGYHVIRMSFYARLMGLELGMRDYEAELLFNAAPLHDIGKIGIPDSILLKPGKLDPKEWEVMKKHSEIGAHIIGDSRSGVLSLAREIALTHHERWDGTGYPSGLSGNRIPLTGRIVAIADVFDALISTRHYKQAWTPEAAVKYITDNRGTHFDPKLVDIFEEVLPEIIGVTSCYKDDNGK